jgi:hypothetical protein
MSLDKIKNVLTKKTPIYLSRRSPQNNSPYSIYSPLSPEKSHRKKLSLDMKVNFPIKSPKQKFDPKESVRKYKQQKAALAQ